MTLPQLGRSSQNLVDDPMQLNNVTPSLHGHYIRFNTTTSYSAPLAYIGTCRAAHVANSSFLSIKPVGSHVPHKSLKQDHAASTPNATQPIDR